MTDLPEPEWLKQDRRYFRRKKRAKHLLRRYVPGERDTPVESMVEPTDMVARIKVAAQVAAVADKFENPPAGTVAVTLVTQMPDSAGGGRARQFFLLTERAFARRHEMDLDIMAAPLTALFPS